MNEVGLRMRRFWGVYGLALCASVSWAGVAQADVAPPPERPKDWNEYPEPMPEVPDEKPLERHLVPLFALGLAGCTFVITARRKRRMRQQRAS